MKTIKISQKKAYDLAKWLDEQCAIIMHRKFDGDNFTVFNEGVNDWLQFRGMTEEERIGFMLIAHINGISKFNIKPLHAGDSPKTSITFYLPYGFELIECIMVLDADGDETQNVLTQLLAITFEVI